MRAANALASHPRKVGTPRTDHPPHNPDARPLEGRAIYASRVSSLRQSEMAPENPVGQPREVDQHAVVSEVARWASADENIRMVIITGSVARDDHDVLSDVDVELFLRDPSGLLEDRSWYATFGEVLAVEELPNPGWKPTRLLYLVDGKIDFAICAVTDVGAHPFTRPFRVLVDKDHMSPHLSSADAPAETPPSEAEFSECVNWFAAAALMQAKLIVRNEPWLAKQRDHDLKAQLLRMIEWDHRSRQGWDYETWYLGKHINQWADPEVRDSLDRCWTGFDIDEMRPALQASVALFDELAERTRSALGFPRLDRDRVHEEIRRILEHPAPGA